MPFPDGPGDGAAERCIGPGWHPRPVTRTVEGARIFSGPQGQPDGWLRRFVGVTDGDAAAALERCKEVLVAATHSLPGLREPDRPDFWQAHLPTWFLARWAAPQSDVEAAEELVAWRSLDAAGRARHDAERAWAVEDWVAWFDWRSDLRRPWLWWDGGTLDDDRFWVQVEVKEEPAALGTLLWMMRAAGASTVVEE
jgi:hypothetical protein